MEPYYFLDEGPRAHLIQRYIDEKKGRKFLKVGFLKGMHNPSDLRSWFLIVYYPTGKHVSGFPNIPKHRVVDYGYNIPYKYRSIVEEMKRELLTRKKGMI
jgi:hypothetical protein